MGVGGLCNRGVGRRRSFTRKPGLRRARERCKPGGGGEKRGGDKAREKRSGKGCEGASSSLIAEGGRAYNPVRM